MRSFNVIRIGLCDGIYWIFGEAFMFVMMVCNICGDLNFINTHGLLLGFIVLVLVDKLCHFCEVYLTMLSI